MPHTEIQGYQRHESINYGILKEALIRIIVLLQNAE